ncbi:hypothetical protein J1N35_015086 [Gossypium stocksii]|uniref:Uncharacterized protein n=1 Tax=Gossypium stocksii TaxID=47602 RepID=A0A9D4A9J0_9ROSI|nr:hypothetical protein J1N35_015086 [Gossypium stocksii]
MCATDSSNGSKKSPLSNLNSSLQALLAKATMISLGLDESVGGANEYLAGKLRAEQVKTNELSAEVMVERERNVALDAELRRIAKEHKATKETLKTLSNLAIELKSNILMYTQVAAGSFDAHKVDFDALYEVDMNQLGFDVHFSSGPAWDEFSSKWKNSKDFYLDEGPAKLNVVPTNNDNNTIIAPAKNIEVAEMREREDEITGDLEGG